jgi:hypothetical protein
LFNGTGELYDPARSDPGKTAPIGGDIPAVEHVFTHFAARYVLEPDFFYGNQKRRRSFRTYTCRDCGANRIADRVLHERFHPLEKGSSPFASPVNIQKMYETLRCLFE